MQALYAVSDASQKPCNSTWIELFIFLDMVIDWMLWICDFYWVHISCISPGTCSSQPPFSCYWMIIFALTMIDPTIQRSIFTQIELICCIWLFSYLPLLAAAYTEMYHQQRSKVNLKSQSNLCGLTNIYGPIFRTVMIVKVWNIAFLFLKFESNSVRVCFN